MTPQPVASVKAAFRASTPSPSEGGGIYPRMMGLRLPGRVRALARRWATDFAQSRWELSVKQQRLFRLLLIHNILPIETLQSTQGP